MSEKIQGWREEIDDSGYHWLVLRDAQRRILAVPESREPAYISAGRASRPMANLLNALTSERDEAVRVAGELRAKAALADAVLDEWDDCSYLPQCDTLANAVMTYAKATGQIYDRCKFCARHAILTSGLCRECNPNRLQLDALTQGGDLPLKEQE